MNALRPSSNGSCEQGNRLVSYSTALREPSAVAAKLIKTGGRALRRQVSGDSGAGWHDFGQTTTDRVSEDVPVQQYAATATMQTPQPANGRGPDPIPVCPAATPGPAHAACKPAPSTIAMQRQLKQPGDVLCEGVTAERQSYTFRSCHACHSRDGTTLQLPESLLHCMALLHCMDLHVALHGCHEMSTWLMQHTSFVSRLECSMTDNGNFFRTAGLGNGSKPRASAVYNSVRVPL